MFFVSAGVGASDSAGTYQPAYADRPETATELRTYKFGYFPHRDVYSLYAGLKPIAEYINRRVKGFGLKVDLPRDDREITEQGKRRELDFFGLSANNALGFRRMGYRIFAKLVDSPDYYGVVMVRKSSHISRAADLKGKTIGFASPGALVSGIGVKYVLKQNGLDADREADVKYFSSQDSVLMSVASGLSSAGGCSATSWIHFQKEHPEVAAKLEVKWRTPVLPSPAFVVRNDIPEKDVASLRKILVEMGETEEGRKLLSIFYTKRIEVADESSYREVKSFLEDYKKLFGRDPWTL
jgi:phosphonate transport system substrate-binding protein